MPRTPTVGAFALTLLVATIVHAAPFTPGNVVVATVPEVSGSQPVTLTEYTSAGAVVQAYTIPNSGSPPYGGVAGLSIQTGQINFSDDGYLYVAAGYINTTSAQVAGYLRVSTSSGNPLIDQSVSINGGSTDARGVEAANCRVFADTTALVKRVFGGTSATLINGSCNWFGRFGSDLYISTQSNTAPFSGQGVYKLPITAADATKLTRVFTTTFPPYGLFIADANTIYVGSTTGSPRALYKFTSDGSTWTNQGFNVGVGSTNPVDVDGIVDGDNVTLFAVNASQVFRVSDTLASTGSAWTGAPATPLVGGLALGRSLAVVPSLVPPTRAVNVTITGAGTGTVTKNPVAGPYAQCSTVTLTATADSGSVFAGWTGDVPSPPNLTNPLPLVVDTDKNVTALFSPPISLLTFSGVGTGVVMSTPPNANYSFPGGPYFVSRPTNTLFSMTVLPIGGWVFDRWTGNVELPDPRATTINFRLTENKSLTANFFACTAPTISQQPAPQSVIVGTSATFVVGANGTSPQFQWRKGTTNLVNGGNITGADTATLTINPAYMPDVGQYNCVITNLCGSATSNNAALSLTCQNGDPSNTIDCNHNNIPDNCDIQSGTSHHCNNNGIPDDCEDSLAVFTSQPTPRAACLGGSVTMTAAAAGPGTLSYQWTKITQDGAGAPVFNSLSDDAHRTGSQTPNLTLDPVAAADAGGYVLLVSSSCNPNHAAYSKYTVLSVGAAPLACLDATVGACFGGLGFLHESDPPPGFARRSSFALGISADGSTVVGSASIDFMPSDNSPQAVRWTRGACAPEELQPVSTSNWKSQARCVSADGSVIAGQSEDFPTEPSAVRWTQPNSIDLIGIAIPPGPSLSIAYAASADGSVIAGTAFSTGNTKAFRWIAGSGAALLPLSPGPPQSSEAYGISADGTSIVGANGGFATRWLNNSTGSWIGSLPGPGTSSSVAMAASANGAVIVGGSTSTLTGSSFQAFRWENDNMIGLGVLPTGTARSVANAVSADGSIIVGQSGSIVGGNAFIWDAAHGMRNVQTVLTTEYQFDLTGWTLVTATGISADGSAIVGYGTDPIGKTQAWIARMPALCADNSVPNTQDCNANGIADNCDIIDATSTDKNKDFIPDECQCITCPGDANGDNRVDGDDVQLFAQCLMGGSINAPGCRCADLSADNLLGPADTSVFVDHLLGLTQPSTQCP